MGDVSLTCELCGTRFTWSEKEQEQWPDDLNNPGDLKVQPYCKGCRPKQDGQRS